MTKGDLVLIIGSSRMTVEKFKHSFPRGIFGKIIGFEQRYSQFNGAKLPLKIIIRCYTKKGRSHLSTTKKYIELLNPHQ